MSAHGRVGQGHDKFFSFPERQIGDDIATGVLAQRGEDPTESALAAIFGALGTSAGMDFLDALRGGDKTSAQKVIFEYIFAKEN